MYDAARCVLNSVYNFVWLDQFIKWRVVVFQHGRRAQLGTHWQHGNVEEVLGRLTLNVNCFTPTIKQQFRYGKILPGFWGY